MARTQILIRRWRPKNKDFGAGSWTDLSRGLVLSVAQVNRPFAASHSRGTKPPRLRAKAALGQDKQRKLPFKITYVFCLSCPSANFALQRGGFVPREWLAAKGLLYHLIVKKISKTENFLEMMIRCLYIRNWGSQSHSFIIIGSAI